MAIDCLVKTTFAELIDQGVLEIGDGYRAKSEELGGDGPIFLRSGHVTDTHIDFSGVERFYAELEPRVRSKLSRPGDAVVTTKGNSTGRTAFVTPKMPAFVYSPHLSYWRCKDPNRIEGGFLRYWSRGPEFSEQLSGMKASTDMAPYLSLIDQKRLRISLPSIQHQRSIAYILGTLDDKIELNRRMNETLESMARALFQSWFMDFDPVRAKAEGRDPGLPQYLADLFPDSFEDSELGEIPKGWRYGRLGDLADIDKGLSYKGEGLAEKGGLPMVNLGCFAGSGIFKVEKIKRYLGDYRERHLVEAGDLLIANTDMTQNRVILGSPALIPSIEGERSFLFTHHTFVFRFKAGADRWRKYLYFTLLQPQFREIAEGFATGTTVLALPRDGLLNLSLVLPSDPILDEFDRQADQIISAVGIRHEQTRTLATLRDTLLPKLISGELRVSEAERFLERVAS